MVYLKLKKLMPAETEDGVGDDPTQATFWFESFQNRPSEFVSIAAWTQKKLTIS
jgi:hypothetical protein